MWLSVNKDESVNLSKDIPQRNGDRTRWIANQTVSLPKGSALRMFSKSLTWYDEPIKVSVKYKKL